VSGAFLVVSHSGCISNLDELSSEYGKAGKGGASGSAGDSGSSGSAGKGGTSNGEGGSGATGATGGDAGESGSGPIAGETGAGASGGAAGGVGGEGAESGAAGSGNAGSGGSAGTGGSSDGGQAGSSGVGGEGGAECGVGLTLCPASTECVDLDLGTPDGDGVTDCGACGATCSLEHASAADCDEGSCAPTCSTGFDDCNPTVVNDGCETSITTITNCGDCGFTCSTRGATSVECPAGKCAPTCVAPYGNCNADATLAVDDGCETNLDSLDACAATCTGVAVACAPTEVCNAGSCGAPQGLVAVSVPFTAANENQRYADLFLPNVDLTGAQVTMRLYAPGATAGLLQIYLSDSNSVVGGTAPTLALSTLSEGWMDITFGTTGPEPFDSTRIKQVTIEVLSGPSSGPWTNPTVIYFDSIRITNLAIDDTFDASLENMFQSSSQAVTGSTMTWLDAMP
jgi:hypothetical protein